MLLISDDETITMLQYFFADVAQEQCQCRSLIVVLKITIDRVLVVDKGLEQPFYVLLLDLAKLVA